MNLNGKTEDEVVAIAVEMGTSNALPLVGNVIDWEGALDRIERWNDIDLGSDLDSPLIRKIKSAVRAARREDGA